MKLKYSGWSRLSKKLINGIELDNKFGSSDFYIRSNEGKSYGFNGNHQ